MTESARSGLELDIHPLTAERWKDLERLFGPRGACGGCWCMEFRLARSDFEEGKGEGNRRALKARVETGTVPPGLLAYHGHEPVGWCAVAPRDEFPKLDRSRIHARIDDRPVWSVACFFVHKRYRRLGVTKALINAAIGFARKHGADLLEGYPVDPKTPDVPPVFAWNGLVSAFLGAGFAEVARRSETRPVMRRDLRTSR